MFTNALMHQNPKYRRSYSSHPPPLQCAGVRLTRRYKAQSRDNCTRAGVYNITNHNLARIERELLPMTSAKIYKTVQNV